MKLTSLHPPPYLDIAVCVALIFADAAADGSTLVSVLPYAISELKLLKVTGTQHLAQHVCHCTVNAAVTSIQIFCQRWLSDHNIMHNCKSHSNIGICSNMHLCLHAENGMHLANNHGAQIASNKIGCDYAVYTMLCYCIHSCNMTA